MPDLKLNEHLLPYAGQLAERDLGDIDLVVMHCTELPDLATARDYGERIHYAGSGTGNSGHYYIDRNGATECWVPPERVAHHVRGFNERSIGIELVNRGRFPHWLRSDHQAMIEHYAPPQLEALLQLLKRLQNALPSLTHIAGHEDLDREQVPAEDNPSVTVSRKLDPGPRFPWESVLEASGLLRYR